MTPPPTDEKALPSYRRTPSGPELTLRWRTSDASGGGGWAREADLVAALAALDPDVRARVLEPYLSEERRVALVGMAPEPEPAAFVWWDNGHDGPGWYYYSVEYQEDGAAGAFKTLAECVLHAQGNGYSIDSIDSPEDAELTAARSEVERLMAELAKPCVARPLRGGRKDTVVWLRDGTRVNLRRTVPGRAWLDVTPSNVIVPLEAREPEPKEPTT